MSRARSPRVIAPVEPREAEHSEAETCAACDSTRVTRLTMTLTDGSPVDFTSCHDCEHKSWRGQGDVLDLTDVLGRATKIKS